MDEIANYRLRCTAAEAMVTDYHSGYPPFVHADCAVPLVPCNTEGEPLVADPPFEYVEILIGGANHLAVMTPYLVRGGPGPKFHCVKVG